MTDPRNGQESPKRSFPWLRRPTGGYVFIVTYGRSGSTFLQNLLNGIEGYCIRGENNNALVPLAESWRLVRDAEVMRDMRKAHATRGMVSAPSDPWYGAERIELDPFGRSLADLFVREVLRPPAGTRVAGFKEIRFHQSEWHFARTLDFMHRFFPGCRIVFNTRDHAAVARSGWWAAIDPEKVVTTLTRAEALYDAYCTAHPDRAIRLHYDDYVSEPERLEALFAYLGEPFDGALVDRVLAQRLDHMKTQKG